jgi:hypothetical protein
MIRRYICVALALLLVACGASSTTSSGAGSAEARPEETVAQALDAMAQHDEAALSALFDASVGELRSTLAFQAIRDWTKISSEAQVPGALGPAQSRQLQPPQARGQATVVRVNVTHQRGATAWEFTMNQTAGSWRLLEIHGQVVAQRQP